MDMRETKHQATYTGGERERERERETYPGGHERDLTSTYLYWWTRER